MLYVPAMRRWTAVMLLGKRFKAANRRPPPPPAPPCGESPDGARSTTRIANSMPTRPVRCLQANPDISVFFAPF